MASEESESGGKMTYEAKLLGDLRATVRSIDSKVEEILDELKEHLPTRSGSGNEWHPDDLYDEDSYGAY